MVDGIINSQRAKQYFPDHMNSLGEDGALSTDAIADAFVYIHNQDRTAWTHELDLRPFRENW